MFIPPLSLHTPNPVAKQKLRVIPDPFDIYDLEGYFKSDEEMKYLNLLTSMTKMNLRML